MINVIPLAIFLVLRQLRRLQTKAGRQLLQRNAGEHNVVRCYEGLNHLMQHCSTGFPSEYGTIEETIAPEVLADIAAWISSLQ